MAKKKPLRFAVGSPEALFSAVWKLVVQGSDVYFGPESLDVTKFSLHKNVWVFAATSQSRALFAGGNRRAKQWRVPPEYTPGATKGPTIVVPFTSLGARPLLRSNQGKDITWYQGPTEGQHAHIEFVFLAPDFPPTPTPGPGTTFITQQLLSDGRRLLVKASTHPTPQQTLSTVEDILAKNVFRTEDLSGYQGGVLLWMTDSRDGNDMPVIFDLPMPVRGALPKYDAALFAQYLVDKRSHRHIFGR